MTETLNFTFEAFEVLQRYSQAIDDMDPLGISIHITHIEALIEVYLQFNLNIYFLTIYIPLSLVFLITKHLFNIFQLNLKSKTLY